MKKVLFFCVLVLICIGSRNYLSNVAENVEILPEKAKVFLRYDYNGRYRLWRYKNTYYFCYKKNILAKAKAPEKFTKIPFKKDSLWPYTYSNTGNLYMIQAKIRPPKLEFIKVAENVEDAGWSWKCFPICRKTGSKQYLIIQPKSYKSFQAYSQFDLELQHQKVKYSKKYKQYPFYKNQVLVYIDCDNITQEWEQSYYVKINNKKEMIIAKGLKEKTFIKNNYLNLIIKTTDNVAFQKLSRFKGFIKYQKLKNRIRKIQKFLDNWEKHNSKKIFQYYKNKLGDLQWDLEMDSEYSTGLRHFLKEHPKIRKKLLK